MADIQEAIAGCCKQLRLSSNLAAQAMTQEGATNQEYLLNLLNNELTYRRESRIVKYINTAGFPRLYEKEQLGACPVVRHISKLIQYEYSGTVQFLF